MAKASRVGETSTSTSSAVITLGGAITGLRTVASKHSVGETGIELVISDTAGNWLEGVYTFTSAGPTVMTRTAILSSSNGDGDVTFPAGSKSVQETASATFLNSIPVANDIAFTTTVPLTNVGGTYMTGLQSVTGPLTFTPAGSPVRGAYTFAFLKANGSNIPDVSAFTEHGSSMGYLNTANILNIANFFNMGGFNWVSWSQAAVPVAIVAPTTVTMTGPTSVVVNVASSNYTVGTDGVRTDSITITPTPVTNVTFTPSSVTLAAGTGTGTFTATSTTTGAKTIAVTNNGGLANPANITLTVAAAATAPAQMAAPVATAGDASASVTGVAPSNGGSAITGYNVTSSPAGGTDSNAGSTSLTHAITGLTNGTAYTFTMTATNAIGTSSASPASNSVTPVAASAFLRLTSLDHLVESGSGPYTYTMGSTTGAYGNQGGVSTQSRPTSTDAAAQITNNSNAELIFGVTQNAGPAFASSDYAIWGNASGGSPMYTPITAGSIGSPTAVGRLSGDVLRFRFVGTTLICEVARTATPTTFTTVYTWTSVSGAVRKFFVNQVENGNFTAGASSGLV